MLLPQELKRCSESLGLGSAISVLGLSVIIMKFFLEQAPITYYLYAIFPAFFWGRAIDQRGIFLSLLRRMVPPSSTPVLPSLTFKSTQQAFSRLIVPSFLTLFALELIVIGYLHRVAWSIGFFLLGFMWPFWGWSAETRSRNEGLALAWGGICTVTAMFTLAGTEKEESRLML